MRLFLAGIFCLMAGVFLPLTTLAASGPDLSVSASSIKFSVDKLYAGDTVRIYATIKNMGDVDAVAQVFFYQGPILIGSSQAISVIADGAGDDVFVDFAVPTGSFNIRAVIQGVDPKDINSANDVAVTPLYHSLVDADKDGVEDENDNCREVANIDQLDSDRDGSGNVCDADDDNDGLSDESEEKKGTSPVLSDTDGDGTADSQDAFPTDSARQVVAPPKIQPTTPVVEVVPITAPDKSDEAVAANQTLSELDQTSSEDVVTLGEGDEQKPSPTLEEIQVDDDRDLSQAEVLALINKTKSSPGARFTYRQLDWRTYEFEVIEDEQSAIWRYGWDFGDGATSVQKKITHAFPRAGRYTVTLAMAGEDSINISDAEELNISFFHLDNPLVQLTLGSLLVILLGLLVFIIKLRREQL